MERETRERKGNVKQIWRKHKVNGIDTFKKKYWPPRGMDKCDMEENLFIFAWCAFISFAQFAATFSPLRRHRI